MRAEGDVVRLPVAREGRAARTLGAQAYFDLERKIRQIIESIRFESCAGHPLAGMVAR